MKCIFQVALATSAFAFAATAFADSPTSGGNNQLQVRYQAHAQATGGGYDPALKIYKGRWSVNESVAEQGALDACEECADDASLCAIISVQKTVSY